MRRTAPASAIGAALAFGSGGSSGDGRLRLQLRKRGSVEPSPYADRNDRGAAEACRRGYPIDGERGWKDRQRIVPKAGDRCGTTL